MHNLALSLDGYKKKAPSNKDWTFGQIVPVILLAAPVLSVIEFFMGKADLFDLLSKCLT